MAWQLCVCVCELYSLIHREDQIRARFFSFLSIYVFLVLSTQRSQSDAAGSDYPPLPIYHACLHPEWHHHPPAQHTLTAHVIMAPCALTVSQSSQAYKTLSAVI